MKILFCIPGATFTQGFVMSWTKAITHYRAHDIEVGASFGYSSSVFHCRNDIVAMTASKDLPENNMQAFAGIDYDFAMWIDSDIVFTPQHVLDLVAHDKEIVTGFVPINPQICAVGWFNKFDPALFVNCKDVDKLETNDEGLVPVDFAGFAFIVVKKGVFEAMEYPWFRPMIRTLENGRVLFPSEDFGWCMQAQELGYQIYADPKVQLGHQKNMTMGPDSLS